MQTEADPVDPPSALRTRQAAILHLERAMTTIEWGAGLALRYGSIYGPGTEITVMMTGVLGASNEKAKCELGWAPRYPRWRQGFAKGLG